MELNKKRVRIQRNSVIMTTPLIDQIAKLVDDETDERVQEALTRFAEMISYTHKIPLALLLRDMPLVRPGVGACIGVTKSGLRCNKHGKFDGYCVAHYDQRKKVQPIIITQIGPVHNHGVPPLYKDNCPACIPRRKLLIDFDGIL